MELTKVELREFLNEQMLNYTGKITVINKRKPKEIIQNNFGDINIYSKFEDKNITI